MRARRGAPGGQRRGLTAAVAGLRAYPCSAVAVGLAVAVVVAGCVPAGSLAASGAPPTVNDRPAFASAVGALEATLSGTINPEGIPVSYHFVYGTSSAYGSVIPTPDAYVALNEEDDQVAPQTVTGLQPGTTYHFALVATSSDGVLTGPDETFTTPSIPAPALDTGSASEVTVNAALLGGSIDPQGSQTTYQFQYGTSTSYGADWPTIPVALGAFTGAQPIVSYLQNLLPGTTYHYRLVASNPGGSSYGADETFTTGAYPPSVVQESPQLKTPIGIKAPTTKTGSTKPSHKRKPTKKHRQHKQKRTGTKRGRSKG
jgi:hypothetical protein